MQLKLRLDLDLYQRVVLVGLACLPAIYLSSLLHLPLLLTLLLAPLAIGLACLKSWLQLEVEDRAVLVTGCDTGFGLQLAQHLESLGFTVFAGCLLADQGGEGARELRALARPRLRVLQLDVTSEEQWKQAAAAIKEEVGERGLWGIVSNAGWATFGEVEWVSMATYRRALDINVLGLVQGIQTMLPLIRRAKGRVVTITSGLGVMAVPTRSPYCLTKYALEGFHDVLRYEMRSFGVQVSVLEPGNFIAGTNIFNEKFVNSQAELMWGAMGEEVKEAYGKDYFDQKVGIMKSYMTGGITDISPVINSYTDALLDAYPQARYQPMDLYFKARVWVAHHLPEALYERLYIGHARR